jgi:hypothetical protein
VRKTYQYNDNDSTNQKLVLTEKFNEHGKITYAKYDDYWQYTEEYDEYDDAGENFYTYRDTFLIKKIIAHNAIRWGLRGREATNSVVNGDSFLTNYEYAFDNAGRIKSIRMVKTEKTAYRGMCGIAAEIFSDTTYLKDSTLRSMKQSLVDMRNETENQRHWSPFVTEAISRTYNDYGIESETIEENGVITEKDVYTYDYDRLHVDSKEVYYDFMKNNDLRYNGTYVYKYYDDHTTEYLLSKRTLKNMVLDAPSNATTYNFKPSYTTIYFDKQKHITRMEGGSGDSITITNLYYDTYGRRIKDVTVTYDHSKLTHHYTYE